VEDAVDETVGACIDKIFDAMEACCIALRMEGENPPETSVPRPT
jgi:hypothetical protein